MNESTEILAILVPLGIATAFSVTLCAIMICCFIRKRKRRQQLADNFHVTSSMQVSDDAIDMVEMADHCEIEAHCQDKPTEPRLHSRDLADGVNHFRVENKPMYITETIGGGSSRRDSNRMSLSTIFSSIGDLLPPATEKLDTTESRTLDDVFTPSLTNIQQKIGEMSEGNKKYYTLTWTTPDFSLLDGSQNRDGSVHSVVSSAGSSARRQATHPIHRIRALRSSGSPAARGSQHSSIGGTPPVLLPLRCSSKGDNGESPSNQRQEYGTQASMERQAKISSSAAELSDILEASPHKIEKDPPVFVTPENVGAYFPNPNTPVSLGNGAQANSTVQNQSDASQTSYQPPHNTPTENNDGNDHQYLMRAVWSSRTSRDLVMDDPTAPYINHLIEQSLHSIDQMEHEQAKLRKGSEVCFPQDVTNSLSTTTNTNHSLSIYTSDLSYSVTAAVPIHCSTIDGMWNGPADERHADKIVPFQSLIEGDGEQHNMSPKTNPASTIISNESDGYIYDLVTMKARVTGNIDESKHDDTSTLEPSGSQWYYNQAYEGSDLANQIQTERSKPVYQRTSEFYQADQSSSGYIRGGYISNNNIVPSGQTSIHVQAGSRDNSSHPSNIYDPLCIQESVTATDTTDSEQPTKSQISRSRPVHKNTEHRLILKQIKNQPFRVRPKSFVPEVPANSPQSQPTINSSKANITADSNSRCAHVEKTPKSSQRFPFSDEPITGKLGRNSKHSYTLNKSVIQQILSESSGKQVHQPLLSPNVYWV